MDARIYDLFMKENDAWNDMITRQRGEIPTLEKMLSDVVTEKRSVGDETMANVKQLQIDMQKQERYMEELKEALDTQQTNLAKRKRFNGDPYAVDTLFNQNILREKIRTTEKTFLELKCNFLNYMATIL